MQVTLSSYSFYTCFLLKALQRSSIHPFISKTIQIKVMLMQKISFNKLSELMRFLLACKTPSAHLCFTSPSSLLQSIY